ncbi:MAG: integrase core domain-containing protein [Gemmatimonadales bacterium]
MSRKTGHKWWRRYEAAGTTGLHERSRRPQTSPTALTGELAALCVRARQAHPTWGRRKLLAYLARRHPQCSAWPVASTVGALLKREGLVRPRRRRPHPGHPGRPSTAMTAPNVLWSADFNGQFRLGTGAYCYPLTVVDGYSRYLLACRGLQSVATLGARGVFEHLFRMYGLPDRIRKDNVAPFATCALGRLSALSVWWLKLGITPELIQPAHPEQNGRHERMHRTLKAEATKPPATTWRSQQRRFDRFQQGYNVERPHEALGQVPPAHHYVTSPRPYPPALSPMLYPRHFETRYVSTNGGIRWHHRWVNVSHVLGEEYVGLEEVADGVWSVHFGSLLLGRLDERDYRMHGAHNRQRLSR